MSREHRVRHERPPGWGARITVLPTANCVTLPHPGCDLQNHAIPAEVEAALWNTGTAVDGAQPAFAIVSVASTGAGQFPVVTFRVLNPTNSNIKTSPYWVNTTTGAPVGSLTVGIGWRTGPYTNTGVVDPTSGLPNDGRVFPLNALTTTGNVNTGSVEEVAPGTFKVTSKVALPAIGVVPITVAVYGRAVKPGVTPTLRIPLNAAVGYYSSNLTNTSTGAAAASVKATAFVSIAKCNNCHKNLSLHGGSRQGSVELCATCHNTEATWPDWFRPDPITGVPAGPVEGTVDFKVMVHEIHNGKMWLNGEEGASYPAPGAYCQACHVDSPSAYFMPMAGSSGTSTKIDPANPANNLRTTPWFATCGSCHTQGPSIAHMRGFGGGTGMTQAQIDALNGNQAPPALRAQ